MSDASMIQCHFAGVGLPEREGRAIQSGHHRQGRTLHGGVQGKRGLPAQRNRRKARVSCVCVNITFLLRVTQHYA
jgi:hypothetical protein